jgi:hypothetical protein
MSITSKQIQIQSRSVRQIQIPYAAVRQIQIPIPHGGPSCSADRFANPADLADRSVLWQRRNLCPGMTPIFCFIQHVRFSGLP